MNITLPADVQSIIDQHIESGHFASREEVIAEAVRQLDTPRAPERVLEIIGLGESTTGSNIARHKDEYLGDAADHRGA